MSWNYKRGNFKRAKSKMKWGKVTGALHVCGLPNAGPCVYSLENLPPFSDPMSSSIHNFLLLELSCLVGNKFQLFPMVLLHSWRTLALLKVGSTGFPLSAYNSIHWWYPNPHIPASASLCLRTFFFFFVPWEHSIHLKGRWEWQRKNALQRATLNSDWWKLVSNPKSLSVVVILKLEF